MQVGLAMLTGNATKFACIGMDAADGVGDCRWDLGSNHLLFTMFSCLQYLHFTMFSILKCFPFYNVCDADG